MPQTASGITSLASSPRSSRARTPRELAGSASSKLSMRSGSSSSTVWPGLVATPSLTRRSTSAGSFQLAKSCSWSAPSRNVASCHSGCARSMSTVRAWSSSTTSSSGKAARARARRTIAGVSTLLWPGLAATTTMTRSRHSASFATRTSATWPLCGGSNAPPKSPSFTAQPLPVSASRSSRRRTHGRSPSVPKSAPTSGASRQLQCLFADLHRCAALGAGGPQRTLELLLAGRRPDDAEATLGAEERPRPRLRLRPVDEELGQVVGSGLLDGRLRHEREERAAKLLQPLAGRAGESEHADDALVLDVELRLAPEVDLVEHDDLGTGLQARAVRDELGVDRPPLLVGVVRRVDHVHERTRALEVGKEIVAEADTLARPLDQPGDVGDDQLPAVGRLHRAEHGLQRRERIVGDLRPRVRDPREERRLAGVRQPDERGVGE